LKTYEHKFMTWGPMVFGDNIPNATFVVIKEAAWVSIGPLSMLC
jgi:hypothetical protein